MLAALFSVVLIASETATVAPASPPAATVANGAAEAADPNKKICKRQQVTGQLQGTKRVCMTAEQWKRVQETDQRRR
jgi:hypothetical protein